MTIAPDFACEILAPSTEALTKSCGRGRKLAFYARERVPHVWLIDPIAKTLEHLRLGDAGEWVQAAKHTGNVRARIEPFDAVELDLSRWWV
jgi:Uma2 family endonuclease